jgi:hypothetical protein
MLRSGPSFASSVFSLYVVQISSSQSVGEIGVSKKKTVSGIEDQTYVTI